MGLPPLPRLCTGGSDSGASCGPCLSFARGCCCNGAVPVPLAPQPAETWQREKDLRVVLGGPVPQDLPAPGMC